jgi:hypothetical protein
MTGVDLYVGGHASRVQGEAQTLGGKRMFTAAHRPQTLPSADGIEGWLDSGAFTDRPEARLTPDRALDRQLAWEELASNKWDTTFQAAALVSYDLLIDETWTGGIRQKRRWDVRTAEQAVTVTVEAAAYLACQRARVTPRRIILSAQGVDALQYAECSAGVLSHARPGDIFGLGGWCILGRQTTLMREFWSTLRIVLPMVVYAGLTDVHIFGVLYLPALGGLLWLADQYGLSVSTDSTSPILNCTWKDKKKSGARMPYWRDNVKWWQDTLANLRTSPHYTEPPDPAPARQEVFLWS